MTYSKIAFDRLGKHLDTMHGLKGSHISVIAAFCASAGLYALHVRGYLDAREAFISLTLALLAFLASQIYCLNLVSPRLILLNPVVMASFATFALSYGITNLVYFLPEENAESVGVVPDISSLMVKHMWLISIAAVAMWSGYRSFLADAIANSRFSVGFQSGYLPSNPRLRVPVLILIAILATTARMIQVDLGVFGYASRSYDHLIEMASVTQYLSMFSSLGKGTLAISAIWYYSDTSNRASGRLFPSLLVLEVFWGFLSGFKGQVVFPLVIVALSQYMVLQRISKKWLVLTVFAFSLAYSVIEPFRSLKNSDSDFDGSSIGSIGKALLDAQSIQSAHVDKDDLPLALSISLRSNLTWIGTFGIEYVDENRLDPDGDPQFLKDLLLSPVYSLIPRYFWDSKPLANIGLWYHQAVIGWDTVSSTGMGPVTYLYFAGGVSGVLIGFFFMGLVHRSLYEILKPWLSFPGSFVFLANLGTVSMIDSSFNQVVATLVRDIPITWLLAFVLFKSSSKRFTGIV